MGLERPASRAEQIAGQFFALGRVQTAAEIVAQLDAIESAAVKAYAARVMQAAAPPSPPSGPVAKLESHRPLRRAASAARASPDAAE